MKAIKRSVLIRTITAYAEIVLKASLFSFLVTRLLLLPVYVEGYSMSPVIEDGTIGFSNIASRHVFGIERFDIVLIRRENGEIWIKRVIALPNEQVEMKDSILYINGKAYEEAYLPKNVKTEDFGPVEVKEHEVFVMGDNRKESYDSRMVGTISMDCIISKDLYALND